MGPRRPDRHRVATDRQESAPAIVSHLIGINVLDRPNGRSGAPTNRNAARGGGRVPPRRPDDRPSPPSPHKSFTQRGRPPPYFRPRNSFRASCRPSHRRGRWGVMRREGGGGGDESVRRGAESQWIVAARPLCHLQYPVAYLSRLQRILPAVRSKLIFKAARRGSSAAGASPTARAHGGQRGPY